MTQACSRCGRVAHVEYGSDGLAYCSACVFYGLNKQCWKCRMYLPASELQQYKGQWVCPICIQDMRYQDRKASEYKPDKEPLRRLSYSEQCERCGRDLETVYIWNGRKLCKSCMGDEQSKWGVVGGGPMGASQKVSLRPLKIAKKRSLLQHMFDEFLALFGLRKKRVTEIIAVEDPRMPIKYAKPMQEDRMEKKYKKGKVEGLMQVEKDEERDMKLDSEGLVGEEKTSKEKKRSKKKAVPKKRKRRKKKPKK